MTEQGAFLDGDDDAGFSVEARPYRLDGSLREAFNAGGRPLRPPYPGL
jgi:hypothetical protein